MVYASESEQLRNKTFEQTGSNQNSKENIIIPKNLPLAIYELDLSTLKFKWINEYVSKLLGYSETELLALKVTDLLCDDSKKLLQANIKKTLKSKQIYFSSELQVKTKNGSSLWGLFNSKVIIVKGKPSSVLVFAQDITKHKKTENDLRLSENKYSKAFLNCPFAVTLTRLSDGKIVEANKAAARLFGYTLEEVAGKGSLGFWAEPNDRSKFISEVSLRGSVHNQEIVFVKKDGSRFQVNLSSSVITIQGEKYLLSTFIDISESKKAEELLKNNEKLYKAVFDNSQDAFQLVEIIYNEKGRAIDGRTLKVNQAFENLTGIKAVDAVGKTLKQLAPDVDSSWFNIHDKVIKKGKTIHAEFYHDFEDRYYDAYYFPYSEKIVGLLYRDITDRKKAEEALKLSNHRINEILESISDDFMVLDRNWNYIYANSQAAKLVGLEPKNIVGKNFWKLFPQNKATYIEQNLKEAMEKGQTRRFELLGQYSQRHKLITTYPSAEGIVLIAADITERKRLEKQLQDQERLVAIGSTAGMVGHDIRNPLQSIINDLYLMRVELNSSEHGYKENILEGVESIEKCIKYINKIVADLQDYARPLNPEFSEIDITEVMTNVIEELAVPEDVEVIISSNTFCKFRTDPTFIRRILANLVNNAIQAMPNGGILELTCSTKRDTVSICVCDSGVGIAEEVQVKLFTPMMTTKAKGQGLGLAVVKRLVEALGGNISFESKVGKGTKFVIEFPLTKKSPPLPSLS